MINFEYFQGHVQSIIHSVLYSLYTLPTSVKISDAIISYIYKCVYINNCVWTWFVYRITTCRTMIDDQYSPSDQTHWPVNLNQKMLHRTLAIMSTKSHSVIVCVLLMAGSNYRYNVRTSLQSRTQFHCTCLYKGIELLLLHFASLSVNSSTSTTIGDLSYNMTILIKQP